MFNEKIYIFLWFWMVLVSVMSISSFISWSYKSSFRSSRTMFVRKYLVLRDILEPHDRKRSDRFADTYLRQDGVFILRIIALNAGELVTAEIVERLWSMYLDRPAGMLITNDLKDGPRSSTCPSKALAAGSRSTSSNQRRRTLLTQHLNNLEEDPGEFV